MIIRVAEPGDRERLLALTREFLELTPYGAMFPPKPGHLERLFDVVVERGSIWCAVDETDRVVGMIAGVLVEHMLTGWPYVEEVIWFVEKAARPSGVGTQLLDALEDWATTNGAVLVKMLAPADSPVGVLLERKRQYTRVETAFMRMLARPTRTEPKAIEVSEGDLDGRLQRAVRRQ
jgi:GNAT superfamily N-acetyltransferase